MRTLTMPMNRWLSLPLTAALLLVLGACSDSPDAAGPKTAVKTEASHAQGEVEHSDEGEVGEHAGEGEGARAVTMDAAALKAAGIRLRVLQPSAIGEQLRAPGEVLDSAYGTTLITPRIEAMVVRRHARLGEEVEVGAALVSLASVEVADAQAALRIAEQEWQRVSALGREAVAGRRITEARVALDRARATVRAYGLPGTAAGRSDGEFTLTAPRAGRITEDDFVVGQRIEPGQTLFRLVDESIVWVDAKVAPRLARRIEAGSPATVVVGDERIAGSVLRSAHRTSEATRNAAVRIEVPNPDDRLHAGDFVEVHFDAAAKTDADSQAVQLAVPTEAVVRLQGDTVVFRQGASGALEPVPVRIGEVMGGHTIILEGLKSGDTVVVEGAFTLKSRMLKAQLGEGHAH